MGEREREREREKEWKGLRDRTGHTQDQVWVETSPSARVHLTKLGQHLVTCPAQGGTEGEEACEALARHWRGKGACWGVCGRCLCGRRSMNRRGGCGRDDKGECAAALLALRKGTQYRLEACCYAVSNPGYAVAMTHS